MCGLRLCDGEGVDNEKVMNGLKIEVEDG